jgi:sugar phosphate isomerase/epimerase
MMKLSISNIAWKAEHDEEMYTYLAGRGFTGLEIAPTRLFGENPYDHSSEAREWADRLYEKYGLSIPSMQSIWYGRKENIFADEAQRESLIDYTKRAIDFAAAINCGNLVFGCPANRSYTGDYPRKTATEFFARLGEYAASQGTVIALEANPAIYNTNFINESRQAFTFAKEISSPGLLVNADLGTQIQNEEDPMIWDDNMRYINHIHISEPGLALIKRRKLHEILALILKGNRYSRYVSIEMKTQENLDDVKNVIQYIGSVFS